MTASGRLTESQLRKSSRTPSQFPFRPATDYFSSACAYFERASGGPTMAEVRTPGPQPHVLQSLSLMSIGSNPEQVCRVGQSLRLQRVSLWRRVRRDSWRNASTNSRGGGVSGRCDQPVAEIVPHTQPLSLAPPESRSLVGCSARTPVIPRHATRVARRTESLPPSHLPLVADSRHLLHPPADSCP
jgi:hypothetical protein